MLQYIVEEAAEAGIRDVLLVTGRGKTSMVDHFDRQPYLESRLEAKGDQERLAAVRRPASWPRSTPAGRASRSAWATPISYAESHVGSEPFAVLLGDEFVDESTSRCCRR